MGEGRGKDGGTELMVRVVDDGRSGSVIGLSEDKSLDRRDSGSGMRLALTLLTLEEIVRMVPMSLGELIVERSRG